MLFSWAGSARGKSLATTSPVTLCVQSLNEFGVEPLQLFRATEFRQRIVMAVQILEIRELRLPWVVFTSSTEISSKY
jgi:hypothetical protein